MRLLIIALIVVSTIHAQYFVPNPFQDSNQASQGAPGVDAIPLSQIQSITLHEGKYTTHRRVSAVPQLKCAGGDAFGSSYRPKVIQCYNKGSDGKTVNWKCEADLDERVKFGSLNVQCEGYRFRDDDWVLQGSCGLEYELDYTNKDTQTESNWWSKIFSIGILALSVFLIYRYIKHIGPARTREAEPIRNSTVTSSIYPQASVPPYNPEYSEQ
jgi:hypothetical protein